MSLPSLNRLSKTVSDFNLLELQVRNIKVTRAQESKYPRLKRGIEYLNWMVKDNAGWNMSQLDEAIRRPGMRSLGEAILEVFGAGPGEIPPPGELSTVTTAEHRRILLSEGRRKYRLQPELTFSQLTSYLTEYAASELKLEVFPETVRELAIQIMGE